MTGKRIGKLLVILTAFGLLSGCMSYSLVPLVSGYSPVKSRKYSSPKKYSHNKNKRVKAARTGDITVKKGDTVYKIARKYNVPMRSLIQINRLSPPYMLKAGQELSLPPVPYHIVRKGDTVYGIARRYNLSVSSLARLNSLKTPYTIKLNQKLLLPAAMKRESRSSMARRMLSNRKSYNRKKYARKTPVYKPKARKFASADVVRPPDIPDRKKSFLSAPYEEKKHYRKNYKKSSAVPKPPPRSKWNFAWPVYGKIIAKYGAAGKGLYNDGINIEVPKGTPVLAAENGVVVYAGNELKGFGNLLLVKHSGGWMTAYSHNDKVTVKRGQKVKRGEQVAFSGDSGNVAKPQLHFEIRSGVRAVNPLKYMEKMKTASLR